MTARIVSLVSFLLIVSGRPSQTWPQVPPDGPDGWTEMTNDALGLRAEFPGEPHYEWQDQEDAYGVWVNHSYRLLARDAMFQVTVKDYARYDLEGVSVAEMLDVTCASLSPGFGGVAPETSPLAGPHPGLDCRYTGSGRQGHAVVYWAVPRLIAVVSGCSGATATCLDESDRFHQSIRVLELGAAAPPDPE